MQVFLARLHVAAMVISCVSSLFVARVDMKKAWGTGREYVVKWCVIALL